MGQRVNIQYSVELDDLEGEVIRLYENAVAQLENATSLYSTDTEISLGLSGAQTIDQLRQKLSRIDIALGDIQNIIEGYVRFKTQPPESQAPESPSQSEELEMEQIEDKIAKFKEMLNAQSNQELEEANE